MECIFCGHQEKDEKATVCSQCGEQLMTEEELERQFAELMYEVRKDQADIEKQVKFQEAIRQIPKLEPVSTESSEEKFKEKKEV